MFSTNLIILGIFSLISIISIIIQAGWKFTHKWIPKLPKNKRWSDLFISTGQLSVIIFIFYTVNIWLWTDSSENKSDIYKMTDTIKLLEWKASNASQYFSTTTNILSFKDALDALPEEAEEYTNLLNGIKNFNGLELLAKFHDFVTSGQCALGDTARNVYVFVKNSKKQQTTIESYSFWPMLRQFMKNGSTYETPFMNKREQINQHLDSVDESIKYIANKFKEKEQDLRNKMMQTTNGKNREFLFWYVLPSMVVFIFTILSIYTTTFNPQLLSSSIFRMILNVLFYIVAIHIVVVFIFEMVSNSNQCQPDPQLFDFYNFEIPQFNKSSKSVTKEDFLNCETAKSHIFSAPNDEIFIPTSFYDEYLRTIPDALISLLASPLMGIFTTEFYNIDDDRQRLKILVPLLLQQTTACAPLREHKSTLEKIENLYVPLGHAIEPFRFNLSFLNDRSFRDNVDKEISQHIVHRDFPKMQNAIVASIRNHNNMINGSEFDCSPISEAFHHGNNRTCHVINHQIISMAKFMLIGCSVISIITHILKNRKYDVVLEKSNNQQQQNQTNV